MYGRVTLLEETGEWWLLSDRLFWAQHGGKHSEVMEVNVRSVGWVGHKQWTRRFWQSRDTVRTAAESENPLKSHKAYLLLLTRLSTRLF